MAWDATGEAVLLAYQRGQRFDSWEEHLDLERWQKAFDDAGIDTARYTNTIPLSARLPWSHIDVGLEDGFLAREYRKALKDQLSPPCGKAAGMFIHHTNVAGTAVIRSPYGSSCPVGGFVVVPRWLPR